MQGPGRSEPEDGPQDRLARAMARLEIIEALVAAVERRDTVLKLVAAAPDVEVAVERIMRLLEISRVAATAVLDVQIRRFALAEREKIDQERAELRAYIDELDG